MWILEKGKHKDRTIRLLTKEEFNLIDDGDTLVCIDGREVVKGVDYIDDTRMGFLAYGVLEND